MIRRTTMLFPALLLAAAACSGTESSLLGSDVTDPTTLTSRFVPVGGVTVSPADASIETGKSLTLSATIIGKNGQPVTAVNSLTTRWVSSDTMVAKVSGSGVVVALQPGTATINVTSGSQSASSTIKVHAPGTVSTAPTSSTEPVASTTTSSTASEPATSSTSTSTTATSPTTTTTAPTTTAPAPVTSSTGQGLSGLALLSDDFSQYSSTAAFLQQVSANIGGTGNYLTAMYHDGRNAQLASIDPTVLYNGHATLKYTQPGGTGSTPELWVPLPRTVSTMWLRAKIRFSPGFTTTGTLTNSSNAYKLLGWDLAGVDGSGRLEITNTTQYDLYWGAAVKNTTTTAVPNTDAGGGPQIATEWSDGGWYDYIIEYTVTSSTTGVARMWLARDGQTPKLMMTRNRTAASGYTMPQVSGICLGLNFNQQRTATQNQALWWGQWEIVDGASHADPFHVNGGQN